MGEVVHFLGFLYKRVRFLLLQRTQNLSHLKPLEPLFFAFSSVSDESLSIAGIHS